MTTAAPLTAALVTALPDRSRSAAPASEGVYHTFTDCPGAAPLSAGSVSVTVRPSTEIPCAAVLVPLTCTANAPAAGTEPSSSVSSKVTVRDVPSIISALSNSGGVESTVSLGTAMSMMFPTSMPEACRSGFVPFV